MEIYIAVVVFAMMLIFSELSNISTALEDIAKELKKMNGKEKRWKIDMECKAIENNFDTLKLLEEQEWKS